MKKKIWLIASLTALTAISAFAGGVAVGNGKRLYRSPYGFSVQFENELALKVDSRDTFHISNAPLVKSGGKVSEVSFTVSRGEVKTLEDAEKTATREHPSLRFQPARQPGAEGFAYEARDASTLTAFYYYLTSNGDFVRISLIAYAGANGINWIAPIVGTLTYDVTPPVVREIQAGSGEWLAGTTRKIRLRVTDDNSGVEPRSLFLYFAKEIDHKISFYATNDLIPEGNDWYSVMVTANQYLQPGTYVMEIMIADKAFNHMNLSVGQPGDQFYQGNNGGVSVPLVRLEVKNNGVSETTPPRFDGFRIGNAPWKAGGSGKLYLRASDPISGIDVPKLESVGLVSDFEIGHRFYTDRSRNPKDEGNGWYSLELPLDPYLPSGSYHVEGFNITNRAGISAIFMDYKDEIYSSDTDQTGVPLFHIMVENDHTPDVTPPTLLALRVDTTEWRTGGTYRLHFRATDSGSGMYVSPSGEHASLRGYFTPVDGSSDTIYVDQPVEDEGNDWYGVNIPVSRFIQGHDYYLDNLDVTDRAGNWATFKCDRETGGLHCSNSNGPELAPIKVSVSR